MSGLKSRRKGMYAEYSLRNHLRELGFNCDRVPLSGASQGFKGDLKVQKDNKEITVECKFWSKGFETIYKYWGDHPKCIASPDCMAFVSESFLDVWAANWYTPFFNGVGSTKYTRKLKNLEKLKQGCNVLAIKSNNKPWLFIWYYK